VVNGTPWPLDTQERSTVSILQDVGRAPGSFWTSVVKRKSLTPTGFEPRIVQPVASHYAYGNSSIARIFDTKQVAKMRNYEQVNIIGRNKRAILQKCLARISG
jgi:hypothetical protein